VPPAPQNALQAGWRAFGKGDSVGAVALWRPDAEAGNVAMQLLIGSIYDFGQGVPQDDAEAIKWYRMAAAKGSAKGQFLMGAVYARSSQVSDPVKGLAWLKRAERTLSQSGKNADGEVQLTQIQFLAKQVAAGMSADDVAKAGALSSNL
jgi:TPR repeat protein